jgi:hypothetical protein
METDGYYSHKGYDGHKRRRLLSEMAISEPRKDAVGAG